MVSCLIGDMGEAGRVRPLGQESRLDTVWTGGTGSFPSVLTPEKVSRQTKGSVQSELQGKSLGSPEGNRRKPEQERE